MTDEQHASATAQADAENVAEAYERIIDRFVAWAAEQGGVRAAAVIGSRARRDHPADAWADLDVIVLAQDPAMLARDSTWAEQMGEPWISFVEATPDGRALERRVLFSGGLDVDFAFFDAGRAREREFVDAARDVVRRGVRVLLDKDGLLGALADGLPLAGSSDNGPPAAAVPDAATILEVASDFWYHAVWTAKHLRRGELWWAKSGSDVHMKGLLRIALEWDAYARGRDAWFRGRFLEEWADPGDRERLRQAFAHYDEADTWRALGVTMDLFSDVMRRVTDSLQLPYPADVEVRARQLVQRYATGGSEAS